MGDMKIWEAKLAGFATPWWCLLLLGVPGPGQEVRALLGLIGMAVGSMGSLWALASGEEGRATEAARWFLIAIASMAALLMLGVAASFLGSVPLLRSE